MTPYEIKILLHYYATPTDYQDKGEPIFELTMSAFIAAGLLEETGDISTGPCGTDIPVKYKATNMLNAYAEALIAMPLPVQKWVMPDEA